RGGTLDLFVLGAGRFCRTLRLGGTAGTLALRFVALALFLGAARLFELAAAGLLFFHAAPVLLIQALLPAAPGPRLLGLLLLRGFHLLDLLVGLLLLRAVLLLEHVALHVGALHAHFHVDGAGTALRAGQLQLRLRLALQRDLARRGRLRAGAVAASQ